MSADSFFGGCRLEKFYSNLWRANNQVCDNFCNVWSVTNTFSVLAALNPQSSILLRCSRSVSISN